MARYATHQRVPRGVACGESNYQLFTRYPQNVTCKRCLKKVFLPTASKKEIIDMSRLTLVEELEAHSIYHDETGQPVYLDAKTHARLKPLRDINLPGAWETWANYGEGASVRGGIRKSTFLDIYLPSLTFEKEAVANVRFCGHCGVVHDSTDGGFTSVDGVPGCKRCKSSYFTECGGCHGFTARPRTAEGPIQVCENCVRNYVICRPCNIYYNPNTTVVSHRHDGSGCCAAPEEMMQFTMRNDGLDPVLSDTVTRVTLPAGVLSAEGRAEIADYLQDQRKFATDAAGRYAWINLGGSLTAIGDNWQTKEGNYPKRVSRYAYKNFGLKISADVMSEIGNIGARHTVAVDFDIEFSRLFDQTAEEWGHAGSCWWQSYYHCRCAMKSNGGVGLRSINVKRGGGRQVLGRAWLYPLKKVTDEPRNGDPANGWLVPTFNTETPDAFVVYNGYGNLQGYAAPRLIANMQGMTYRKVNMSLLTRPKTGYINSGSGYLVAPEDIATHFTDGNITINVEAHSALFAQEQGKEPDKPKPKKKAKKYVAAADLARLDRFRFDLNAARFNDRAALVADGIALNLAELEVEGNDQEW